MMVAFTSYIGSSWWFKPIRSHSRMTEMLLIVTLTAYIGSSRWWLRPTRRLSWKMGALLTVTYTAYIGYSTWRLDLHGGSPERHKCSWRSLIQPILDPHPNDWTYMEAPLKDESTFDSHSDSLYQVLTLTAKTYTKALLKDRSTLDGPSDNLYRVLTLTAKTYMEALLKGRSAPDSHLYSLYRILTLTGRPTQRLS